MSCSQCGGVEGPVDRGAASEGVYSCDCYPPKRDPKTRHAIEMLHCLTNRPEMYVYTKEAWLVHMDYVYRDLGFQGVPLRVIQKIYAAANVPNPYGSVAPLSELTDTVTNKWAQMASAIIKENLRTLNIQGI